MFCTNDVDQTVTGQSEGSRTPPQVSTETSDTQSWTSTSPFLRIDSQDDAMPCHICAKAYSTSAKLNRHVRRHMPSRLCPIQDCGALLLDRAEIERHVAIQHPESVIEKNSCPAKGCKWAFPGRPDALYRHLTRSRHISRYGMFIAKN